MGCTQFAMELVLLTITSQTRFITKDKITTIIAVDIIVVALKARGEKKNSCGKAI